MSLNQNDYNKQGMFWFVLSMAVSLVVMIYVAFLSGGIDLQEVSPDKPAEQTVAGTDSAAPKKIDLSSVKEAWVPTEDLVSHGAQLYKQNCAMCHGNEGKGDGVAGGSLNPKPRNLVEGKWKLGGGRLGLYKVLHDGIPGTSMQSYKASLKPVDRWALVHFINSITENKVKEDDGQVASQAAKLD